MITEIESDIDSGNYENFLRKNIVTFYQSEKHLRFLERILDSKVNFIISREKEEILGILPFIIKNSNHGKVVNSLPFFGSYGGLIGNNKDAQKAILENLNIFNKQNEVLSCVIISNPFNPQHEIYEKNFHFNNKEGRRVQCVVLDNKSEQTLWESFEQRTRRAVRKSKKSSIVINKNFDRDVLTRFYQMHKVDMESKGGRVKPWEFFENLERSFIAGKDFDILIGYNEDKPIVFLLVFYFSPFTEYYMPAYNAESKNLQGTSLLIWESMKISISKGYQYYNFGGTGKNQTELYKFKKGWNTTDFNYNYYIYRDLNRIKDIGIEEIKKHFSNFYVTSFAELLH